MEYTWACFLTISRLTGLYFSAQNIFRLRFPFSFHFVLTAHTLVYTLISSCLYPCLQSLSIPIYSFLVIPLFMSLSFPTSLGMSVSHVSPNRLGVCPWHNMKHIKYFGFSYCIASALGSFLAKKRWEWESSHSCSPVFFFLITLGFSLLRGF